MWKPSALAILLLVPFAVAQPDLDASVWNRFVGTIGAGERDDWLEWYAHWFPDGFSCTQAVEEVVMVLRLEDASPSTLVQLEGGTWLTPTLRSAYATGDSPAVLYSQNEDGCIQFSITGIQGDAPVRYELSICYMPFGCPEDASS